MNDLRDWLAILLAFLGLFAGGRAGAYAGHRRGARLTDRRRLFLEELPKMEATVGRIAAGHDDFVLALELLEARFSLPGTDATIDAANLYAREHVDLLSQVHGIEETVELLPWLDRCHYEDLRRLLPSLPASATNATFWTVADNATNIRSGIAQFRVFLSHQIRPRPYSRLLRYADLASRLRSFSSYRLAGFRHTREVELQVWELKPPPLHPGLPPSMRPNVLPPPYYRPPLDV